MKKKGQKEGSEKRTKLYLDAKYADGDAVVGETGSSSSSSPKLCDDRLLANRFLRSFNAIYLLRPVP